MVHTVFECVWYICTVLRVVQTVLYVWRVGLVGGTSDRLVLDVRYMHAVLCVWRWGWWVGASEGPCECVCGCVGVCGCMGDPEP